MPGLDKLSGLTARQIDAHQTEAEESMYRLTTTNERITKMIGEATIDNLGPLYAALAIAAQQSGFNMNDTAALKRVQAYVEADAIKKTYQGGEGYVFGAGKGTYGHWWTIGGSVASLAVSGICAFQGIQAGKLSQAAMDTEIRRITVFQTAGSSVGSTGQGFGTYFTADDEGKRNFSQTHQGISTTDNQQYTQEANTAKQLAKQLQEQKTQAEGSRHQAFSEFARG